LELFDPQRKFVPPYDIDQDGYNAEVEEQADFLREQNLTKEQLLKLAANFTVWAKYLEFLYQDLEENEMGRRRLEEKGQEIQRQRQAVNLANNVSKIKKFYLQKGMAEQKKVLGKSGADALHNKPGGSRDKKAAIQNAWASGKYTSRDICAEQECATLGMSFSAARKALRGTPAPA